MQSESETKETSDGTSQEYDKKFQESFLKKSNYAFGKQIWEGMFKPEHESPDRDCLAEASS